MPDMVKPVKTPEEADAVLAQSGGFLAFLIGLLAGACILAMRVFG